MTKKILSLAALLLLAGCQDEENRFITYTMPPSIEQEETTVETVRPSVIVYGMKSVTNGFIIEVDERDKWLVTIASAVSHHPNALIETAEGQLLRATVEAIDPEHNIAIVKFRNSAVVEPFILAKQPTMDIGKVGVAALTKDMQLTNLTSIVRQGEQEVPIAVEPAIIQSLLNKALKKPLVWQERVELSQSLQQFTPIGSERVNKIDTYEKDSFYYNPDALMLTVQQFHAQIRAYMKTKDRTQIEPFIYSDDLIRKLEEVEAVTNLSSLKINTVTLQDTIYEVSGEVEEGTGDSIKTHQLTYQLIKHADKWYIIALKFS
ncbi:MAG: hypothetical protein ABS951_10200 [Solibacillus sp.]